MIRGIMDKQVERRIFGYIDSDPPVAGSWKAEVFRLVDLAERAGDKEAFDACVLEFSNAVARMREVFDIEH